MFISLNPADEILGLKAYPSIGATPTPADMAVVVIPARMVVGAIEGVEVADVPQGTDPVVQAQDVVRRG